MPAPEAAPETAIEKHVEHIVLGVIPRRWFNVIEVTRRGRERYAELLEQYTRTILFKLKAQGLVEREIGAHGERWRAIVYPVMYKTQKDLIRAYLLIRAGSFTSTTAIVNNMKRLGVDVKIRTVRAELTEMKEDGLVKRAGPAQSHNAQWWIERIDEEAKEEVRVEFERSLRGRKREGGVE
jgi:hypothetical protein